jgi:hypothetical protein
LGLHDFASGDVLTDAQMDEIARQSVIPASAFPGTPTLGMICYRTDRDILYRWDGGAWRSLPMGLSIGGLTTGTGTGVGFFIDGTVVDVNGSSITWNSVTSEEWAYEGNMNIASSGGSTYFNVNVDLDGSNIDVQRSIYLPDASINLPLSFRVVFTASTGSHTIKARINRGAGSGAGAVAAGGDFTLSHLGLA